MDEMISSISSRYVLLSKQDIEAEEDVFLIDHMWTTTFPQTRKHLLEIPGLLERVEGIISSETAHAHAAQGEVHEVEARREAVMRKI